MTEQMKVELKKNWGKCFFMIYFELELHTQHAPEMFEE